MQSKWFFAGKVYLLAAFLLVSCAPYFHQPLRVRESRLGAETPQYRELTSLPVPKDKIVVAVYKFRDQTGQYKPSETGANWSTAVTQGSTSILLRALEESNWFVPIERESLANLLNERKIIRSSRASYGVADEKNDPLLPPLLFAGILLEGGIISFDSNILTGGAGARYFGAGASTQYREDRVTIYLRAVSTSNGKILKTVYTSKTILSQKIDVGFFRFVKIKRLAEAETGFTYNEPGEMAVKEAIEKAVVGLVIEGMQDKLWAPLNNADLNSAIVNEYLSEKADNSAIDVYGNEVGERRNKIGLHLSGSTVIYNGDYSGTKPFAGGGAMLEFPANSALSVAAGFDYAKAGTHYGYEGTLNTADLSVRYKFFNNLRYSPFVRLGGGALLERSSNIIRAAEDERRYYSYVLGELGYEYLILDQFGIHFSASGKTLLSDRLDNVVGGKFNDLIWQANFGVSFYLIK
ncbi:MAG TPA: CsgG/HfaB family protein [Chryseosolibacter sp.]